MTPDFSHMHVFIGYDEKQDLAWDVCSESIRECASKPLSVHKLDHRKLRDLGVFSREWKIEGKTGRYEDTGDGRPFSTQFAHSRFLVPALCKHLGISRGDVALFVDSDFVFLKDPYLLLWEASQTPGYPLYCVKHNYKPTNTTKMDNQKQTKYPKKLWSSLMLFNLSHNFNLSAKDVNEMTGTQLHGFDWLPKDEEGEPLIGELNERWNFIPDHSEKRVKSEHIGAIHWTEGLPCYPGYEYCRYAAIWNAYRRKVYAVKLNRGFYD